MLVVPRGEDFCVNARLRRVCLLDSPPGPFTFDERLRLQPNFDLLQLLTDGQVPDPAVSVGNAAGGARCRSYRRAETRARVSPARDRALGVPAPLAHRGGHGHLAALRPRSRDKGQRELQALPGAMARDAALRVRAGGVSLTARTRRAARREPVTSETCFTRNQDSGTEVSSSFASVSPLVRVPIDLGEIDIGGIKIALGRRAHDGAHASLRDRDAVERPREAVGEPARPSSGRSRSKPVGIDDPHVWRVVVDRWAKLRPEDDRNLDFDDAADLLHVSKAHRAVCARRRRTDLRSIAQALRARARDRALQRRRLAGCGKALEGQKGAAKPPEETPVRRLAEGQRRDPGGDPGRARSRRQRAAGPTARGEQASTGHDGSSWGRSSATPTTPRRGSGSRPSTTRRATRCASRARVSTHS